MDCKNLQLSISYIFIQIFLIFSLSWAQETPKAGTNLVNNGGFENLVECPKDYGQLEKAIGWRTLTFTPDLFSTCSESAKLMVPSNFFGNQRAGNGNNYIGLLAYHEESPLEIVYSRLLVPMEKGKKYKVSFRVSLAETYSNFACDNLGVWFTNDPQKALTAHTAHVKADFIVKETTNWATISRNFVADDDYKFIVLGNLFKKEDTKVAKVKGIAYPAAYYYVDDIQVSKVIDTDDEEYFVKVVGGVYDSLTKEPIPDARIDFVLPDIRYRAFEVSDKKSGKFKFSNMQRAPRFYLEATAKGYFSDRVMVEGNDTASMFLHDFHLLPSELGSVKILDDIHFDLNRATLREESHPELIMVSNFLHDHPNFHIEISGHTDATGKPEENLKLSEARAEAVVKYLIDKGLVQRNRMIFKGYGEALPIASNETEEGKAKNRRVELKIVKD
jgi:outer membrane protein OmpA-like peptidoglycan-associated protein